MTHRISPPNPIEPTEVLAALLVGRGVAWPLARSLAPWVQVVGSVSQGETFMLLDVTRGSTTALLNWIDDADSGVTGLRSACAASMELVNALDEQDGQIVEQRRSDAWAALRALAVDLRTARPSIWARQQGLDW